MEGHFAEISPRRVVSIGLERHFADIFRDVKLRPGVTELASAHARTVELSIVQNPACYVRASANSSRSIYGIDRSGGPTDRPGARRKAEERYIRLRIEILPVCVRASSPNGTLDSPAFLPAFMTS